MSSLLMTYGKKVREFYNRSIYWNYVNSFSTEIVTM